MARKRLPSSKPSNAYLVSFGDTMTALLAFFIVLNSLATDQTGANLHAGTGSFVAALRGMGTAGPLSHSASENPFQREDSVPLYIVDDGAETQIHGRGNGPDSDDNEMRVIDRDSEQIQRLITELEQRLLVSEQKEVTHRVSFDLFKSLQSPPHVLPVDAKRVIAQALPLLLRGNHRMEIAVWSTMPGRATIRKAAERAEQIRQQLETDFVLDAQTMDRISCVGRLWPLSDVKRPVITVTVIQVSQ